MAETDSIGPPQIVSEWLRIALEGCGYLQNCVACHEKTITDTKWHFSPHGKANLLVSNPQVVIIDSEIN